MHGGSKVHVLRMDMTMSEATTMQEVCMFEHARHFHMHRIMAKSMLNKDAQRAHVAAIFPELSLLVRRSILRRKFKHFSFIIAIDPTTA